MTESPHLDPAALLAQQPWVERLARGLVRDSSLAQDLAQETWLCASQRGPQDPGALRAFLASVARNLARTTRRGEARRGLRETSAARPDALPSSAELVERAELQRILVESVLALDEAERTAILLCYFENLSAEEIARRARIPAGTVRSRIHRGLERLRTRLEARVDRRDLFAGLVGLARLGVPGAGAPLDGARANPPALESVPLQAVSLGGILAMKLSLLAAGCAALVLGLGIWLVSRGEGPARGPSEESGVLASPAALDSVRLEPLREPVAPPAQRAPLETASSQPPSAAAVAAPAPLATRVLARVVDSTGQPLAGVRAHRHGSELTGTSGRDGRLALELVPRKPDELLRLELHLAGFARAYRGVRLAPGAEVHLGEIVLGDAAPLRGWVEDERGQRLGGVRLITASLENPRTDREELRRLGPEQEDVSVMGRTGDDGAFALEDVPLGPLRLWAGSEAFAWSSLGPLDVPQHGLEELVLVLHPLDSLDVIRGTVLSPEGEPVARARVEFSFAAADYQTASRVLADEQGAFEILLHQRVAHQLTVVDPEGRWSEIYRTVEPGARDLELVFEPARWMELHVRDPGGEPVTDYVPELASAVPSGWLRMTARIEWMESVAESQVRRLRIPNATFRVVIGGPGREQVVRGPFEPATAPGVLAVELAALPGVRGVVLTSAGEPAPGAKLGLYRTIPDVVRQDKNGFRLTTEPWAETETAADEAGRFVLYPPFSSPGAVDSGSFVLRATYPGHAPTELGPRAFDPHEGAELELHLTRGGAIEGRATTPPGVDPTGIVIAFHRGDGEISTRRLGPDGGYRIESLASGPWEVRALDDEQLGNRSSSSSTIFQDGAPPFDNWSCVVVEGETTVHDLDLSERAPCTLRGELALAGRASEGWTAALLLPGVVDEVLASVPLDEHGLFELVAPRGGRYHLVLRGPEEDNGRLELLEELELEPGELDWRLALELGSLEGAGALGRGTRECFYSYEWLGSAPGHALRASVRIVPGRDGRFVLPVVPAGPAKIRRNDPPADGGLALWQDVLELELAPGEVRRIDLP